MSDDPSTEEIRAGISCQVCPWCGKGPFKMLPVHVNRIHGIDKWELRELAGYATTDPLCGASAIASMRAAAAANNHIEVAIAASRRGRSRQRWTRAGRDRVQGNLERWALENPDEAAQQRAKAIRASKAADAVTKHSESLKRHYQEHPERIQELRARAARFFYTDEADAKRAAKRAANRRPCGTAAAYRRGCRCEACRAAKRASRGREL